MFCRSASRRLVAVVLHCCFALFAATAHAAPLDVFVSILPQKYFTERVGGEEVKVSVMVRPGMSPGNYEPTPQQMDALSRTAMFFRIGVPFEEKWLPKLRELNPAMNIVDTRAGITLLPMKAHSHDGESAAAAKLRLDPHIWTTPTLVRQQAANMRDALIAQRPEKKTVFEHNYAAFAADLDALDADIRKLLADKQARNFMVFHPAWGYLAHAYGLNQMPIEIEGKEPGPQALANIIDEAKAHAVRVVFVQQQFSRKAAEAVAQAIGGEVINIDPLAEDFLNNTRHVAQVLAKAMR
jgi:zinc transport system substrate-binding protein